MDVFARDLPIYRLNLDECVRLAMQNNEEIKAASYDISLYLAKKIEATKRYVPVIKYKYQLAPVPQDINNPLSSFFGGEITALNSIKIEAGVPISTFGRLTVAKMLADIGIDAADLQVHKKADEVALTIHKLYNGILLARELRGLANQALDAVVGKIGELEKDDNTDQLEILKLKVILYEIDKKLDEATVKETMAITALKVQMGLEDDVDFNIIDRGLRLTAFKVKSYEDFLAVSKTTRPEFQLLDYAVQAKSLKIELEKKEYLPKLGAGALFEYAITPNVRGDETENSLTNPLNYTRGGIGLELSGELDFRKIKARVEEAKADELKMIAQKRAGNRGLEIDLKQSYLELQQYRNLLNRANEEKKAARQIVFLTKSNLDIGLGEKKDYLDALQSYLVFEGRSYEAIFNYNVAVATLKQKMGIILRENFIAPHKVK
jgi:outer membrane protein TolC